jgi:hypothetical protein
MRIKATACEVQCGGIGKCVGISKRAGVSKCAGISKCGKVAGASDVWCRTAILDVSTILLFSFSTVAEASLNIDIELMGLSL